MAVPRNRLSQSRRDKRRSHHAKKPISLQECPNCGEQGLPHRVCSSCGFYKGREVVSMNEESEE
ncbi:MAG: 50S ribosomal protein L32 [Chlamydiota bacterium]